MADHRGQRKTIFSSLRLHRLGPLLWGLLLLTGNRFTISVVSHTYTYAYMCAYRWVCSTFNYNHTCIFKLAIIPLFPKAWWQLVKPDAICKALLSAGFLSSPVSEDTRWPGGGVLLYDGRWKPRSMLQVQNAEQTGRNLPPSHINLSTLSCSHSLSPPEKYVTTRDVSASQLVTVLLFFLWRYLFIVKISVMETYFLAASNWKNTFIYRHSSTKFQIRPTWHVNKNVF